jgi:VanZ family protein
VIRWLVLGLWYAAIIFTLSLAATPDVSSAVLHTLINKGGHLLGYIMLGWLLTEAVTSPRAGLGLRTRIAIVVTIVAGAALASLDETRQTFVYGRTGQPSDVLLDTIGVSGGALVHQWLARRLAPTPLAASHEDAADDVPDQPAVEDEHQQVHR